MEQKPVRSSSILSVRRWKYERRKARKFKNPEEKYKVSVEVLGVAES